MAKIDDGTFPTSRDGAALLENARAALRNLDRIVGISGAAAPDRPRRRLTEDDDFLRPDFQAIWARCEVYYNPKQAGAASKAGNKIELGPFGLKLSPVDVEKVILHEYLHKALRLSGSHHSFIDQIIQTHLKYPGAPNPALGLI